MGYQMNIAGVEPRVADGETGASFSAPLDGATAGHLLFTHGVAPRTTIEGDPSLDELFVARFERPMPEVEVEGGSVTIEYPRFARTLAFRRELPAGIMLNTSIPWHLEIRGGMAHVVADLRGVQISEIDLTGGIADVRLVLPRQFGTTPIRVHGGISNLAIDRPEGVGVRIDISGGAADLRMDESRFGAIGGEVRWESQGYRDASDRYDIRISGGVSALVIRTGVPIV